MPDKDLSNSQDVRRMSPAEVRKLNKDQLVFALRTLIDEPASEIEAGPQTVQIARIETKLDGMLSRWDKERDALQAEIKSLGTVLGCKRQANGTVLGCNVTHGCSELRPAGHRSEIRL